MNVTYSLPAPGFVSLKVCDITGRVVTKLFSGQSLAGDFRCRWDGRADNGRRLPNGVYFVRFAVPGGTETRTVQLVR
jgi:flagellar hook assembly protein FlgD